MKFHLPKKLFAAVLAAMACSAYAMGPMHTQVRQIVAEGKTSDATMLLKYSNNGPWPGTSNEAPQVWVKDGLGTATVTGDLTLYNPLVVREGTMSMSDCTIKNYTPLSNGVSNLSVGGKDAHLILDGTTYKQDLDYNRNYTSAIAIGTGDGAGKLTLLNGSLLHTDHFIFAGVKQASYAGQPAYVVQTTKSQDDDTLYESQHTEGSVQRSEINIEGGSVLSAGTCLQFADVDVNIKGEGSELTDLNRDSSPASASYSYFAYSQDAETNINITEGAKVNLKQHLMTGSGADSKTNIKADGKGSAFNLLGYAYMGYGAYDYDAADYVSCGATTTLSLSNGASSSFGGLVIGYNDNTSINVDAASTLEVTDAFYAYQSSDITNAGTINAGTFYTSGKMTLSMGSSLSVASLQVGSGASITVDARNGSAAPITVSGAMDLSTGATVTLNFTDAYLSSLETDSSWDGTVKVAFADVDGNNVTDTRAGLAWSENFFWELDEELAWVVEDTSAYICAKLSRKTEIDLTDQEEEDAAIADTVAGAAVSVTAKNQDITLSGNNSYSGGTNVTDANVTLGSSNALGTGGVTTSGTSSLTTTEGLVADVKGDLSVNSGELTMTGDFNVEGEVENSGLLSMNGNTTVNGSINNEGTLNVSGVATLSNDITNSGEISLDGNITATGNITNNGTLSLSGSTVISNTITNNGLLNLNGTVDASGITKDTIDESCIDTDGEAGENGFKRDKGSSITLANNGKNALIGTGTDLVVKHNGTTYEFDSTTGVAYAHGQTHHGVYFINTEDHEVSTSQIDAAGNNQTEKVVMQNGSLNADSDVMLQATGGTLTTQDGTVSGTIADTTIVSEGGTIEASISGGTLALESGEVSGTVTDTAITASGGSISGEISGGTLTINSGVVSGDVSNADIQATDEAEISGNISGGTLALEAGEVSGKVTDTAITASGGSISGEISGESTLEVTGTTTLAGKNTLSGDTLIKGESAKLVLSTGSSLGTSKIQLDDHGTLDMGGNAISNEINVTGCTITGASAYTGTMNVSGNLELLDATSASKVVMSGSGSIKGATLTTTELVSKTDQAATIDGSVNINKQGALTLSNGKDLNVSGNLALGEGSTITLSDGNRVTVGGSLTLGAGTTIILNGDYAIGDELLISKSGSITMGDIKLQIADKTVEVVAIDGALTIVSLFKQPVAEAQVLANWGTMTASRVFVDAVRGQRSNTGCIANGRGTAWAASLGASNEIGSGDITLSGTATGADMKIGRNSSVGVAIGYIEGDAEPAGLRKVEQESTYIALYGEHRLKKLSNTSCLSLDWTAAYGNTESEQGAMNWEQQSVQLNSRLSWNKKVTQRLCISVFSGVEYFANESDRAEGIKTGSIQNLRGELGVGARYVAWGTPGVADGKFGQAKPGCEKLVLNGTMRYMNDMVRSNPVVEMNGLRGMGENPGRQGVGIEAGATFRVSDRWSASANYGFNSMDDSREHRLNVGASYTF